MDLNKCETEVISQSGVETDHTPETSSNSATLGVIEDEGISELPLNEEEQGVTVAECQSQIGSIIGDIGHGAINQPEYRCESGQPPIGYVIYPEDGPWPIEGSVCCIFQYIRLNTRHGLAIAALQNLLGRNITALYG